MQVVDNSAAYQIRLGRGDASLSIAATNGEVPQVHNRPRHNSDDSSLIGGSPTLQDVFGYATGMMFASGHSKSPGSGLLWSLAGQNYAKTYVSPHHRRAEYRVNVDDFMCEMQLPQLPAYLSGQ